MSEENGATREEQNQIFQPQAEPQQAPQTPPRSYDVPVEVVTLPSQGLVYTLDNMLANERQIEIKSMTANEENLLTSQALIKNGTVLSKLLEACILNRTIDASSMITGDRNAILIALRITGYGAKYAVRITCSECDEEYEKEFNLSELTLKPLGTKPLQQNVNLFEFILPNSGRTVHFKLLTGQDEQELSETAKMRKKATRSQIDHGVTDRLMQSVVSLGGEQDPAKIATAIKNMPAMDSRSLRKYIDSVEPGVNMKQFSKCSHCGDLSEVQVPMGLTFFWPDAG